MKKQFIFFPSNSFPLESTLVRSCPLYSIEIGPVHVHSILHIAQFSVKLPADHSGHQSMPHPFVKIMDIELFILFAYHPFNVYRICSNIISFILDTDILYPVSSFHDQSN